MAADREPHATPAELARRIGRSTGTLANWRSLGIGPDYIGGGHGNPVRYPWPAIYAWERRQTTQTAG
jgi:hypothetical protein